MAGGHLDSTQCCHGATLLAHPLRARHRAASLGNGGNQRMNSREAIIIARSWCAYASHAAADAYPAHLLGTVRPKLDRLPGFRGLYLFTREHPNEVEYRVVTLWDSMDAVRSFAGADAERAVVEPEAAALLSRFDERVTHYDVIAQP
jgi:heme-degrading monooxygenase HmoA